MNLVSNNLQRLICHKTQTNKQYFSPLTFTQESKSLTLCIDFIIIINIIISSSSSTFISGFLQVFSESLPKT